MEEFCSSDGVSPVGRELVNCIAITNSSDPGLGMLEDLLSPTSNSSNLNIYLLISTETISTLPIHELQANDVAAIDELREDHQKMRAELGKFIVGQLVRRSSLDS